MPVARPESSDARVIAHIDMDCFYVQVEQRKQPHLRGLPTAVVQYNSWKGGGLIAVSYEARKFGVKRSMRGDEAKKVCPQIQLVQVPVARGKADLKTYRDAGSEVVRILSRKGRCERASIDEVYLDLTDAAEKMLVETPPEILEVIDVEALKSHVIGLDQEEQNNSQESVRMWLSGSNSDHRDKLLACGTLIVAELRMQVLKETEFTCSAGIAHNKMLAKLASAMNKPAQQTVVLLSCVKGLLESLPIKKMKQLGGKLGSSLESDLGAKTVGDLLKFSEQKLQQRYGINTGTWLWNIARGISGEEVECRLLPKSHGSGKTFSGPQALRTITSVQHWLNELCQELSERISSDLDQNKRIAHTLTLHASAYKLSDSDPHKKFPSKSCPLRYGAAKIQEDALNLFQAGLRDYMGSYKANTLGNPNSGWRITSLSVSASKIISIPSGTSSITKYLHSQKSSCSSSEKFEDKLIQEAPLLSVMDSNGAHDELTGEEKRNENDHYDSMNYSMMDSNGAHDEFTGEEKKNENGPFDCMNYSMMDSNEAHDELTRGETKNENGQFDCMNYSIMDSSEAHDGFTIEETKIENGADICSLDQNEGGRTSWKDEDSPCSCTNPEKSGDIPAETSLLLSTSEERKFKNATSASHPCMKRNTLKDKGTASILKFFKPDLSYTSRKQELAEGIQNGNLSSDGGNSSELTLRNQVEERDERWNYKVDEIDTSVIDELPPEIQKEIWSWLRPHKRVNRGSSIARYFLPANSS